MSAKLRKTDAYGVCKWCKEEKEEGKKKKDTEHTPVCNSYLPALCVCEVCGRPYSQHDR